MLNKLTAARLVPRAIAGATVSAYEAAIRSITDLEGSRPDDDAERSASGAALADLTRDVTHEPTKDGVLEFFRMYRAAFPICGWNPKTFWPAVTRSSRACERPELTRVS